VIKLSPAAELAVRAVLVLAERYGQGPVNLETICAQRDLPRQYLAKILALLARADLVTAVRGKHGGYLLSREPGRITLLEVIETVEGPIALNFCQHDPPKCDHIDCPLRTLWGQLQSTIRKKLGAVTLKGCVTPPRRGRRKRTV